MSYCIIDDFLSEKDCDLLISDAKKVANNSFISTHENKRMMLASSSYEFKELLENSSHWSKFNKKISSGDFLDLMKNKLSIKHQFFLTNFFSKYSRNNKNHISFKNLGLYQLRNVNLLSLTKYIVYKFFRQTYRYVKYNLLSLFKSQPIELLYDYSKASNGYKNMIHRDTDSRVLIILIYLNKLEPSSVGGSLKIFKNISGTEDYYPKEKDIKLIKEIKPKPGRLVAMINNNDFFHSTEELAKLGGTRDFIYGGYTILSGKNPFLKKNKKKYKTAYHLYD